MTLDSSKNKFPQAFTSGKQFFPENANEGSPVPVQTDAPSPTESRTEKVATGGNLDGETQAVMEVPYEGKESIPATPPPPEKAPPSKDSSEDLPSGEGQLGKDVRSTSAQQILGVVPGLVLVSWALSPFDCCYALPIPVNATHFAIILIPVRMLPSDGAALMVTPDGIKGTTQNSPACQAIRSCLQVATAFQATIISRGGWTRKMCDVLDCALPPGGTSEKVTASKRAPGKSPLTYRRGDLRIQVMVTALFLVEGSVQDSRSLAFPVLPHPATEAYLLPCSDDLPDFVRYLETRYKTSTRACGFIGDQGRARTLGVRTSKRFVHGCLLTIPLSVVLACLAAIFPTHLVLLCICLCLAFGVACAWVIQEWTKTRAGCKIINQNIISSTSWMLANLAQDQVAEISRLLPSRFARQFVGETKDTPHPPVVESIPSRDVSRPIDTRPNALILQGSGPTIEQAMGAIDRGDFKIATQALFHLNIETLHTWFVRDGVMKPASQSLRQYLGIMGKRVRDPLRPNLLGPLLLLESTASAHASLPLYQLQVVLAATRELFALANRVVL